MESLMKEQTNVMLMILDAIRELDEQQTKTNQLLTLLIQALGEGDPDALPAVDMDGNPV